MKIIIAGSRSLNDYVLLKEEVEKFIEEAYQGGEVEIVSGTARGADQLGERLAKEKGYRVSRFPADWSIGKSAGYKRNADMAKYADSCIVFMEKDGTRGSQHMINLAKKEGLVLKVVLY